jgi:Pyruvate/2-oxoacid:ferredoxin oxidoreductase delta subunit
MGEHEHRATHTVRVDVMRCSLCEACARHCPSSALFVDKSDGVLRLLFRPDLCTGCPSGRSCRDLCPEEAIRLVRQPQGGVTAGRTAASGPVLLAESAMLQCRYCGEFFAPVQKIDVISKKSGKDREPNREYCPLCRRTNMVVRFIDDKRMPAGKAEYRSGKDILRRSRERREAEKKQDKR